MNSGQLRDLGLLVARVGFGGTLILLHGLPKITELLVAPVVFHDPLGIGPTPTLALVIFAEVACALAVVIGLFFRPACAPLLVNFGVIVLVMHRAQVPSHKAEVALLYLVAFSVLALTGPGRYSFDSRRQARKQE